eukprot:9822790-Lingulodinium_polyedra.AAC.1
MVEAYRSANNRAVGLEVANAENVDHVLSVQSDAEVEGTMALRGQCGGDPARMGASDGHEAERWDNAR